MTFTAAVLAASLAAVVGVTSLPLATPAEAGQVTFRIKPRGQDAQALRTGLALYSIFQGFKNRARVVQNGNGNAGGVAQNGTGNGALLVQDGNGQTGAITQTGNGNGCALLQFGRKTSGSCNQSGNGGLDLILQGGW